MTEPKYLEEHLQIVVAITLAKTKLLTKTLTISIKIF